VVDEKPVLEDFQAAQLVGSTVLDWVTELEELLDLQLNQLLGFKAFSSLGRPHAKLFEIVVLLPLSFLPVYVADESAIVLE